MLQKQTNQQLIYEQFILKIIPQAPAKPKKCKAVKDPPSEPPSPKSRVGRSGRTTVLCRRNRTISALATSYQKNSRFFETSYFDHF